MRLILTLSCTVFLHACASSGPPVELFTDTDARARIVELAGSEAPRDVAMLHSYGEQWQLKQINWGHKFTCTNGPILAGYSEISLHYQEGNLVSGTLADTNQCGDYTRWKIEGRYNGQHLYVQFGPDNPAPTAIRRYAIGAMGGVLIEDHNYTLVQGAVHTHVYPRSGSARGDKIYTSSNFVARSNLTVANFMNPAAESERRAAAIRAAQLEAQASQAYQAQNSGGGFGAFMGNALTAATILSDTSGQAYNNYVAQNVPGMAGVVQVANALNDGTSSASLGASQGGVSTSPAVAGGRGAVTPGSYPARPNTLDGGAACQGYSVDNYKEVYSSNSNGPDAQLHAHCAGAYNYYWMYLNAIRQGYSQADSDRTYAAFEDAAKVTTHFYQTAR